MFDAERAKVAASPLIKIYQDMEDELIQNIAKRFRLSENGEIDIRDWYTEKMMDMGVVNRKNVRIIAGKSGIAEEQLEQYFDDIGYGSLDMDESIYQMAFSDGKLTTYPVNVRQSSSLQNILRSTVEHAKSELNLVNTTARETAKKAYTDTVNKAYLNVVTGTRDYNSAIKLAVKELAEAGVKGSSYISSNGTRRTEQLDVAVRRSVLTSSSQLAGDMQMKRAEEWGSDLVEVTSHMGSRPSHAVWQGRVYSLSGKHKKYPDFRSATRYGEADGLKGINCRHDFYPFFEGISEQRYKPYDLEKNNEAYKSTQEQRGLEREIRKEKRKSIAAEASGDVEGVLKAEKKISEKQKELRELTSSTGMLRQSDREQVSDYKIGAKGRANSARNDAIKLVPAV